MKLFAISERQTEREKREKRQREKRDRQREERQRDRERQRDLYTKRAPLKLGFDPPTRP